MSVNIHETIRRLLQMTVENGASIQEAETAAAAIRRLLDKHGLTIEEIRAKHDQSQHGVEAASHDTQWRRLPLWVKGLGASVAEGLDCRMLHRGENILFLGFPPEPAVALYLFRVLSLELPRAADRQGRFLGFAGDELRDWKDSFLRGAGNRIGLRFLQERSQGNAAKALIVCKEDAIDDAMRSMPFETRLKQINLFRGIGSGNGFLAGDAHGRRVCLDGRPLPAPQRQPELAGFLAGGES